MRDFFRRYRNVLAGIGAIVTIAAGFFTFIGNSSDKTTNSIPGNSGPVVGVGKTVTIEEGAVTIEYDRDQERLRSAQENLAQASFHCARALENLDNGDFDRDFQFATAELFSLAEFLDAAVNEAFGAEFVSAITDQISQNIHPNLMALHTISSVTRTTVATYESAIALNGQSDAQVDSLEQELRKADPALADQVAREREKAVKAYSAEAAAGRVFDQVVVSAPPGQLDPVFFDETLSRNDRRSAALANIRNEVSSICSSIAGALKNSSAGVQSQR